MTYLIHSSHDFLDFKHLLMFLMSLGGMKASTIVQVRKFLHRTRGQKTSHCTLSMAFFCLSSGVGLERKKRRSPVRCRARSFVEVQWVGKKKEKRGSRHERNGDSARVGVPRGNGQSGRDK